jgi:alpha-L-fucosidase 2
MSSSPEFHDGGINAWFLEMTNYDRSLSKYTFLIASEMAGATGNKSMANHWKELASQIPSLDIDSSGGLTVAPGFPYRESHRHFSHLMAIYPLGILNYDVENDRQIILNSLSAIEEQGPGMWCGYSYSWLGNIYARMKLGDKAAKSLSTFSSCFCSANSFHLNGDQCKAGNSQFTYSPFTLEGNFAFASGIQEMLLQSQAGYIEAFPAIPSNWKNVSFNKLRAQGAFLVSATKANGVPESIRIESEKGGKVDLKLPFRTYIVKSSNGSKVLSGKFPFLSLEFSKGGYIVLVNGYE